jgi:hypothetical protein
MVEREPFASGNSRAIQRLNCCNSADAFLQSVYPLPVNTRPATGTKPFRLLFASVTAVPPGFQSTDWNRGKAGLRSSSIRAQELGYLAGQVDAVVVVDADGVGPRTDPRTSSQARSALAVGSFRDTQVRWVCPAFSPGGCGGSMRRPEGRRRGRWRRSRRGRGRLTGARGGGRGGGWTLDFSMRVRQN